MEKASQLVGGDVVSYFNRKIAAAEEQLSIDLRHIGLQPDTLNLGNAPAHPVLYAAIVTRPNGLLTIRGQTEPFGQYSLFLPPDAKLSYVSFYDPETKRFGVITPNLSPKARYPLPRFNLAPLDSSAADSDRDGLPDLVEGIFGTDPRKTDSDGDGIADGAEIEQGTDPLGGLVAQTGVIATVKTPGAALDIWTGHDLALLAEGPVGVSIVDISNPRQPTILAHVDTPGTAERVAASGNFVAVADGGAGMAVIDITDLATARIVHQVNLAGTRAVAAGAGTAYVGLDSGRVVAVNLREGTILQQVDLSGAVKDLALDDDHLYALTGDRLFVFSLEDGALNWVGSAASPFRPTLINQRLFVGGGIAYATHRNGYNTLDVTNPANPVLIKGSTSTQFGWRQIVANGSGLGLAAVGSSSLDGAPHDVSLYDLGDPRSTDVVITAFPTPGNARAVSIFNGLAFVADDSAGLQVINYLPYDAKGIPPTITLSTSFSTSGVEENKLARVTARVTDDVQVRHVEFYLEGVKSFTDEAFPFEFRFMVPQVAPGKASFRLRARAFDTGGNSTWSEEMIVALIPDTKPPHVTHYSPLAGAKALRTVTAYFDGRMAAATLNASSFKLVSAGADGAFGTTDDVTVGGGSVSYQVELGAASLNFASPVPDGLYRAVLTTAVTDLAANHLSADYSWPLRVADAVFWVRTTDGLWSDPLNWSGGALPGPKDSVILDVPPYDVTITQETGTIQIKDLIANERLKLGGGILEVLGPIQINRDLTLDGGTIKGRAIAQNEGARLIITADGGNTLDGVTLDSGLDLTGARVRFRNGVVLNGPVVLDKNGTLSFAGDQTFDNSSVVFAGDSGFVVIEGNTTLTLGTNLIVRGKSGTIGVGLGGINKLINQGLIAADVAGGRLAVQPSQFENLARLESKNGASLVIGSPSWSNSGRIEASAGAALSLNRTWKNSGSIDARTGATLTLSGEWDNPGMINANAATVNLDGTFTLSRLGMFNRIGGTVSVIGELDLQGGTLALDVQTGPWALKGGTVRGGRVTQNAGAKLIITADGGNTLDGISLDGDLEITGARLRIRNSLMLSGSVLLDKNGSITFEGNQTFDNASIVFVGTSGSVGLEDKSSLTLGPKAIVRGLTGTIGSALLAGGSNTLINQGLISADVAGGTLTIRTTRFENTGTVAATAAGSLLKIQFGPFLNTGTTLELNGGKVIGP